MRARCSTDECGVVASPTVAPDITVVARGLARSLRHGAGQPRRLVTDHWQHSSDGMNFPATGPALDLGLPGTGYPKHGVDRPQWVRNVVLIASSEVGRDLDGRELWDRFEAFLEQPPVSSVVGQKVSPRTGLRWAQRATNRATAIDAILTSDGERLLAPVIPAPRRQQGSRAAPPARAYRCKTGRSGDLR